MPFMSVDLPDPLEPTTAVSDPRLILAAQMMNGRVAMIAQRQIVKGEAWFSHQTIRIRNATATGCHSLPFRYVMLLH